MGKRKQNKEVESKRKKAKQDQDAQLSTGLFSSNQDSQENDEIRDWDNEEQDYELRPRNRKSENKMVEGLPIKMADGRIERVVREVAEEEIEPEEPTKTQVEESKVEKNDEKDEEDEEDEDEEDADLSPQERLNKIKEEVADLASKLIEDPEENILCLTRLRKMSESRNMVTCQLSMMALIPVFKSLAPTYKIRPLTDTEKREKVSKEVARLRQFEQSLISNYNFYVDNLAKLAKVSLLNSQNNKKITPEQIKKRSISC